MVAKIRSLEELIKIKESICPECSSEIVISGTLGVRRETCSVCGIILGEDNITHHPKRAFGQEEINSRRHREPVDPLSPRPLGSHIDKNDKDIFGNKISPKARYKFYALRKIEQSLITTLERNLSVALPKLIRIASDLELPKQTIERAKEIYKKAAENKLCMGRTIIYIAAASVLAASREFGQGVSLDDVVYATGDVKHKIIRKEERKKRKVEKPKEFHTLRKGIGGAYRLIHTFLDLRIKPDIEQYVPKLCEDAAKIMGIKSKEFVPELQRLVMEQINYLKKNSDFIQSKRPKGIDAALIYIMANSIGPKYSEIRVTQSKISRISKISEVTIRNHTKKILNILPENIREGWEKYGRSSRSDNRRNQTHKETNKEEPEQESLETVTVDIPEKPHAESTLKKISYIPGILRLSALLFISSKATKLADEIYKKAKKRNGMQGKAIAPASFLAAGKILKQKIPLEDIISFSYDVLKTEKEEYERALEEVTNAYCLVCETNNFKLKPDIKKYVPKLCKDIADYANLKKPISLEKFVIDQIIYLDMTSNYLLDKNRDEAIAGLAYIWFKLYGLEHGRNATQDEIAKVCKVPGLKVYESYKEILNLLPDKTKEKWKKNFG